MLARSGWPLEQIAIYEALIFLSGIYTFFWLTGGQNALLQLYPKLEYPDTGKALSTVFIAFAGIGVLSAILLFCTLDLAVAHLTRFDSLPHTDLLAGYIALNSPSALVHLYYLLLRQYRKIIWFGIVGFLLQLLVVAGPVWFGLELRAVLWGLIGWAGFKGVWAAGLVLRQAGLHFDLGFLRKYGRFALPLLLLAFIGKGSEMAGTFMVAVLFDDPGAFAIYRYGAREVPIALVLLTALATSVLPLASGNLDEGLAAIKRNTQRLSHLLYPISILAILASPFLFPFVFGPQFAPAASVFNTYTLFLTSRMLLPHTVAMAKGHNYAVSAAALVEFLLAILLSYLFGRWLGLVGIALGLVLAYACERLALILYLWFSLKISPGSYIALKSIFIYNTLLVAAYLLSFILR